jgi:hypothetical protein
MAHSSMSRLAKPCASASSKSLATLTVFCPLTPELSGGEAVRLERNVRPQPHFLFGRWVSVLAAADFDAELLRPSRRTFDAAVPADEEVTLPACLCASALPDAVFDAAPVLGLRRTPEAFVPTDLEVVSPFFAITFLLWSNAKWTPKVGCCRQYAAAGLASQPMKSAGISSLAGRLVPTGQLSHGVIQQLWWRMSYAGKSEV